MASALPLCYNSSSQIHYALHKNGVCKFMKPSFNFQKQRLSSFTCFSSNKKKKLSFMDQILDYIEGGPKLRKWYGAPDIVEKGGNTLEQDDEAQEEEEIRDAVLVTDGENEISQMIILSLIVKRVRVKALVKDKRAAMEAFGTYVEALVGDTNDKPFLKKALRGTRAVICPVEGFSSDIVSWKGVQHVILLSQEF